MTILRHKVRKNLSVSLFIVCSIFFMSAQAPVSPEYQVKAVFLFNFTQFVEWPPASFDSEQAPLVIGILGENPFGAYMEGVVSGEKVNGHPLAVYHYKNTSELKICHVLFINKSETNNMNTILTSVKGKNILTVSDAPGFLAQGGMIRFITRDNKINLQINPDAAKAENLVISSKLLRLAEIMSSN